MELSVAVDLIRDGVGRSDHSQLWADLGAGSGLFSQALASLLPNGSVIHAIDKSDSINQIVPLQESVRILPSKKDFVRESIGITNADGLLMANSLHFVKDKRTLMKVLASCLRPSGKILVIEYDLKIPNAWVPYPVTFEKLVSITRDSGFHRVDKIGETGSVYNNSTIYSALIIL